MKYSKHNDVISPMISSHHQKRPHQVFRYTNNDILTSISKKAGALGWLGACGAKILKKLNIGQVKFLDNYNFRQVEFLKT